MESPNSEPEKGDGNTITKIPTITRTPSQLKSEKPRISCSVTPSPQSKIPKRDGGTPTKETSGTNNESNKRTNEPSDTKKATKSNKPWRKPHAPVAVDKKKSTSSSVKANDAIDVKKASKSMMGLGLTKTARPPLSSSRSNLNTQRSVKSRDWTPRSSTNSQQFQSNKIQKAADRAAANRNVKAFETVKEQVRTYQTVFLSKWEQVRADLPTGEGEYKLVGLFKNNDGHLITKDAQKVKIACQIPPESPVGKGKGGAAVSFKISNAMKKEPIPKVKAKETQSMKVDKGKVKITAKEEVKPKKDPKSVATAKKTVPSKKDDAAAKDGPPRNSTAAKKTPLTPNLKVTTKKKAEATEARATLSNKKNPPKTKAKAVCKEKVQQKTPAKSKTKHIAITVQKKSNKTPVKKKAKELNIPACICRNIRQPPKEKNLRIKKLYESSEDYSEDDDSSNADDSSDAEDASDTGVSTTSSELVEPSTEEYSSEEIILERWLFQ